VKETLRAYYWLTKPGIIYGNAISAIAGFLLAAHGEIDIWLLVATLVGISLVIGAACVFNNFIDRGIDTKMARTKSRALATGAIKGSQALSFGTFLGLAGFTILGVCTNWLTVLLGGVAVLVYVALYGYSKRRWPAGTLVGSIAGALPPVGGYTAVSGQLDTGALLLFLIITIWQMPHFYAIAIYRLKDYKAAGLPVLPAKKGVARTRQSIIAYSAAFTIVAPLLTVFGYTSYFYFGVVLVLGILWLCLGLRAYKITDEVQWARKMFFFSLIVMTGWSAATALDATFLG
jgi:heme o synthase